MGSTQRSGTTLEWRWKDETDNRPLPESWARKGPEEPIGDDEQPLYAIQCRGGLLLEWTVSRQTNAPVAGPNRERPALRVLYVTRDGQQAAVREWDATRQDEGWTPESAFASVIAKSPNACDDVDVDHHEYYRSLVEERYDVE
ncbi:hypothetical protein EGH23_19080 [Halomicroarcula sp. F27]|uniref:Uncharacterized protein n=1 Tax=Haloarcula nitratireducens TaxID=2487749 RepID=A0AAW4PFX2_9EURY|nr:hypothetical protein [Halomicroarcula nitratireducens]